MIFNDDCYVIRREINSKDSFITLSEKSIDTLNEWYAYKKLDRLYADGYSSPNYKTFKDRYNAFMSTISDKALYELNYEICFASNPLCHQVDNAIQRAIRRRSFTSNAKLTIEPIFIITPEYKYMTNHIYPFQTKYADDNEKLNILYRNNKKILLYIKNESYEYGVLINNISTLENVMFIYEELFNLLSIKGNEVVVLSPNVWSIRKQTDSPIIGEVLYRVLSKPGYTPVGKSKLLARVFKLRKDPINALLDNRKYNKYAYSLITSVDDFLIFAHVSYEKKFDKLVNKAKLQKVRINPKLYRMRKKKRNKDFKRFEIK